MKLMQLLEGQSFRSYIKCRTKGGMIVDVFGIEAFLPGSQIDVHPIRDYTCIRRQDNGIQGRKDQSGIPQCCCFSQGSY